MTKRLVALQINVSKAFEGRFPRDDKGQGTLEYIGAIMIAAIVVAAVATAFKNYDLGTKVSDAVNSVFDKAK